MNATLESKPRFAGCPLVCVAENLPSFASQDVMGKWFAVNCAGSPPSRQWQCGSCGGWHAAAKKEIDATVKKPEKKTYAKR